MTVPVGLYLADTSAIVRASKSDAVRDRLVDLANQELLATCVTIDLELGYSARTPAEHYAIATQRSELLIDLPLVDQIGDRARVVQSMLAASSQHRAAGAFDLLTAAIAEYHGATVLHYDADFDHIATITGQPTEWIAPRGSLA